MKYVPLGQSGVQVSCIGLGTAAFGVAPLAAQTGDLVARALDLGINLLDTANSYGNQPRFNREGAPLAEARESAEELLCRALGSRRRDVVLCSKVGEPVGAGPNNRGLSRRHIFEQVENSLRRLGTDYIDVYYAHHPDPQTPIEHTVCAFSDLVKQGKIRYYGLSTFSAWEMVEVLWASERLGAYAPVCNQLSYSLLNRGIEEDVIPACQRYGLSVMAFSPLGGGLLAGKEALNRSSIGAKRWGFEGFSIEQLDLAHRFNALADANSVAPVTLALAWLTAKPSVSTALIGAENVHELETAAAAGSFEVDSILAQQLDELNQPEPRLWY